MCLMMTGKTYTMLGVDQSQSTLGIIPCAIYWLFKLINDRKEQTGARFSVRVSAVEITGKQETLKDLLADVATGRLRTMKTMTIVSFGSKNTDTVS